ncbi:fused MFS/spermidine synthase [Patescibacteria group bacterium]|nr:fused MFS/spermidine synthase [Patescibacteria group bacterium]
MTKSQHSYLKIFVFGTGFIILVLELTASRLFAPYFGASIFVWANIIGIILLALALGYWLGGKLADRRPEFRLLMRVVLVAGLFVSFIPLLFRLLTPFLVISTNSYSNSIIIGSFTVIVVLFFIPAFLLGIVSPFAVRLFNQRVETTGSSAGSLYAWSTAGSIVGTFTTAFLAVPYLGTHETIYCSAFILILLSAIGQRRILLYIFLLLPIVLYFIFTSYNIFFENGLIRPRAGVVYEKESPYQFIQVIDTPEERRLVTSAGFGTQTSQRFDSILTGKYFDFCTLLPPAIKEKGEDLKVMIIGVAGGAISRLYDEIYSDEYRLIMDGVDVDPMLVEAGRKFFGLGDQPINIHIADGRTYLYQNDTKYDVIIVDAYENQTNIPFHLTTQEFFQLTSERLTDNGVISINIGATQPDSRLLVAFLETLAEVYPYVYTASVEGSMNYMVTGSGHSIDFDSPDYPDVISKIAREVIPKIELYKPTGKRLLTDNWAPIELLTDTMYLQYIWEAKS